MDSQISLKIELFFENPLTPPRPRPTHYGVLYLLRREIITCFNNSALWAGIMIILAGVDLLGKFYAGNDDIGNVGSRFVTFLKYFNNISEDDKDTIYQLRNSLLHSFGLYSVDSRGNIYKFTLGEDFPDFIKRDVDRYYINVLKLKDLFNIAIENYYKDLKDNVGNLQSKFEIMFPRYGFIYMTP